jgi:hypothetical protein
VTISATNGSGTGSATLVIMVNPSGGGGTNLLSENFSSLTTGSEASPSTVEVTSNLTANFPTSVKAFSAGGKVKLGNSSLPGSVTSKTLDLSGNGGVFNVSFDVKGWTTVEGSIKVTVGSLSPQTVAYTATMSSASYETKTLNFTGGQANSTVKIETTAKRAFIDNVIVATTGSSSAPAVSVNGALAAVNTTYGTASPVPTNFTVSGSNLTEGILINAPLGYEISQTAGGASGYATTQTVGGAGTVGATTIYVRLQATAPVGTYFGNITCNSAGSAGATLATVPSSVAKKQLTIIGLVGVDKEYDTTNAAGLTGTPSYLGLVNGDSLSVTGVASATFTDKNVGTNKTVTISGFTDPNGNYSVTAPTFTASITPKEVVILGLNGVNKTYDGTSSGTLNGTASLLGVATGDESNVLLGGTHMVSFVSANAGLAVEMVVSGYTLTGAEAANYALIQPIGLAADITPKPATIVANDRSKVLGTTLVLGAGQTEFTSSGLVSGERIGSVTLTPSGGTEADAPRGIYSITPSEPVAAITIPSNTFREANYEMTYIDGTLSVNDAPTTFTLSDWAVQNGLTGADALPGSDPDKDGMSNLMEYYLGLSPTSSSGGGMFTLSKGSNNTVSLTYRRAKGVTGVSSAVQATGDLSISWGTSGVQETVVDKGTYEEVTATVTNAPGATKMFMRLKVSQP